MWTNEIVKNNNGELFVEFTSPENRKFVKKYNAPNGDIETFLAEKLANIEALSVTFTNIQSTKNVEQEISTGWSFKLTMIEMQYDYIEIVAEVQSPSQTLYKMFQITAPRLTEYIYAWIEAEKNKLADWIFAEDIEALSDYFGQEVVIDVGNN
jgi:hypothetical protein